MARTLGSPHFQSVKNLSLQVGQIGNFFRGVAAGDPFLYHQGARTVTGHHGFGECLLLADIM
jgi:hypothetical protein